MLPLLLLALPAAHASDFADIWISTALEDDNILAGPDADSPSFNFVQRGNTAFFETYESRATDDISQAELVLYRADDSFFKGWHTEAAFAIRLVPFLDPKDSKPGTKVQDDGSYVRVIRDLGDARHNISLTGYAVDANRFRLGYSYDLTWGGTNIYSTDPGAAPGVRLQYQNKGSYAFVGAKTAVGQYKVPETEEQHFEAYWGTLIGGGIQLGEKFKVEAGFGTFQQGQMLNVQDTSSPLYGEMINALGVAGQVAFRSSTDLDFIQSADLRLYRNGPDHQRETYIKHVHVDGLGVLVQAEINRLSHNLLDAETTDSTVVESGMAGDVQTLLVAGHTAVGIDLVYKDLAYILFNVPGLTSGVAMNPTMSKTPQLYGRVSVQHYFQNAHLTPSLGGGLMQPATYDTSDGTFVQYTDADKEQVPEGQAPAAILSSVLGAQLDISRSVTFTAEVLYTVDANQSQFVQEGDDLGGTRVAAPSNEINQLGGNLILKARF